MPSTLEEKERKGGGSSSSYASAVGITSLNRDGTRSAFTPYKPTTVLTNLQRGNVQTQASSEIPERGIHHLAAQGELFFLNEVKDPEFDPDVKDNDGLTPLMWASCYGQLETVRNLLSFGAMIEAVGNCDENSLMFASAAGCSIIVKELITHGAPLDHQDKEGNTALMYAACNNHGTCLQELLNAGADFTIINEAFESAFDISVKRRSKHAQAILEKQMLKLLQPNKS